MERIAYPGEAALWELDWRERNRRWVGISFQRQKGHTGCNRLFLVSCQPVQHRALVVVPWDF